MVDQAAVLVEVRVHVTIGAPTVRDAAYPAEHVAVQVPPTTFGVQPVKVPPVGAVGAVVHAAAQQQHQQTRQR